MTITETGPPPAMRAAALFFYWQKLVYAAYLAAALAPARRPEVRAQP